MSLEKYQFLHRATGFIVIVFVLFFALTGIILNHADQWGLGKKYLDYDWLLDMYAIGPSPPLISYAAGNAWLSHLDARLYFNGRELPERADKLSGFIELEGVYIAALQDALLLLTENGEVIEKITSVNGLPGGPQKISKMDEQAFVIATVSGNFTNRADIGEWVETTVATDAWSGPGRLPPDYRDRILSLYRGNGVTMERVFQDLHSGRLLGPWRIILVDIVALLLIISALSGAWMWYKKKKIMASLNNK
jgi:hypothetical protein